MNRKKAARVLHNIEVLKAFVNGAIVQIFAGGTWTDLESPNFDDETTQYRVKPAPVEMEVWYHDSGKGDRLYQAQAIKESDSYMRSQGYRKITVREVV